MRSDGSLLVHHVRTLFAYQTAFVFVRLARDITRCNTIKRQNRCLNLHCRRASGWNLFVLPTHGVTEIDSDVSLTTTVDKSLT